MKKDKYNKEIKEFKKIKRDILFSKIKHAFNIMPEKQQVQNIPDPDISSITEHIAFVLDDEVVEIMHCQPKLAAILLSEPKIIKIKDGVFPKPGWKYLDNNFISPEPEKPEITVDRDLEAIENNLLTFEQYKQEVKKQSLPTFKDHIEKLKERILK